MDSQFTCQTYLDMIVVKVIDLRIVNSIEYNILLSSCIDHSKKKFASQGLEHDSCDCN